MSVDFGFLGDPLSAAAYVVVLPPRPSATDRRSIAIDVFRAKTATDAKVLAEVMYGGRAGVVECGVAGYEVVLDAMARVTAANLAERARERAWRTT